jgi:hypothetical protein
MVSVFIMFALSIVGVNAQTQRRPYSASDRQITKTVRQLERSSAKFRTTLNGTLNQKPGDNTVKENQINSLDRDFENASNQFLDRFNRRRATAADVQNVMLSAAPLNDLLNHNPVNSLVENDWGAVRTDLTALANAYGLTGQWNRQTLPPVSLRQSYPLSDKELDHLIQRIEKGGDALRSSLTAAFDQTRYDPTRSEGSMNDAIRRLKNGTNQLRNHFDASQLVADDVERLIGQATPLEKFMRKNQVTDRAQNDWSTLRRELTALAHAYSVDTFWRSPPSSQTGYSANNRLSGTFRLDASRSDNPRDKAKRATQNVPDNERRSVYDQIMTRLESPAMLAIERRGATITMASSLAPQATFEADGRERQEPLADGRSARVIATLRGEQLVVSSNGYKENDFNVTFDATENKPSLRVRRQIYSDRLTQPVVVDSVYDRTADVAQWNVYKDSRPVLGNTTAGTADFILRDETIVAVLNNDLSTKLAKAGDPFSLTVRAPDHYEGAVLEGIVGSVNQGGQLTGWAQMTLKFNTIRLRSGQSYRFAGMLASVRTANGDTINVDNEGSAQGDNQTNTTIQRADIGTPVGAVIGAVVGGGKGAVIDATIGAAGGAASVYVQGKDDLELPTGTELTIRPSGLR